MKFDSLGRRVAATSLEAWEFIQSEGLLSKYCEEIYSIFLNGTDMTVSECWATWRLSHPGSLKGRNEIAKIISHLAIDRDCLETTGEERKSRFTGAMESVYRLTLVIPEKKKRKPKTRIQEAVEAERARCLDLTEIKLLHCQDMFARNAFADLAKQIQAGE